jgi:hypothetical protein
VKSPFDDEADPGELQGMTGPPESGEPRRSFFGELERHHVFRVLAVYVAVALGVLQVASLILDPCTFPPGR